MLFIVDGNNLSRYKKVTGTELKNSGANLFRWEMTQNGNIFAIVDHPEYLRTSLRLADSKKMKFFSRIFHIDLSDVLSLYEEDWILSLLNKDSQH